MFDNILANFNFLSLTFGSGNVDANFASFERIAKKTIEGSLNKLKFARSSPTPMENILKAMFDSPYPGPS